MNITLPDVNGVPAGQYDIMEVKIKPTGNLGPVTVQILDKNGVVVFVVSDVGYVLFLHLIEICICIILLNGIHNFFFTNYQFPPVASPGIWSRGGTRQMFPSATSDTATHEIFTPPLSL